MCKSEKSLTINGRCLYNQLRARGITGKEASVNLGYSSGYIHECCRISKMPQTAIDGLHKMYGILPDTYVKEPQDTAEREFNKAVADLMLYKLESELSKELGIGVSTLHRMLTTKGAYSPGRKQLLKVLKWLDINENEVL